MAYLVRQTTKSTHLWYFDVDELFVPLGPGFHFFDVINRQLRGGGHFHVKTCRLFVLLFLLLLQFFLFLELSLVLLSLLWEAERHDLLVKVLRDVDGHGLEVDLEVSLDRDASYRWLFAAVDA